MIASLLQRFKGELALALMRTFIARGIAAVGGIVLFIVLGRLYGAEGVGVFALAQSIYLGAGILARYGMDNALMRYVGQDPTASAVPVYLRLALTKSALLSTVAAVLVFLLRDQFALWFDAPMLGIVLPGIALAIPPFTVAFVLAGFMKGIRKPATACLLENGGIALVATLLVLLFDRISTAGIDMAGWAMAVAAWLVFAQGLCQVWNYLKTKPAGVDKQKVDSSAFNSSSNAFFVMSLAPFMQQTVFVMIAGFYLSDIDLGLFKAAEKLALTISFILIVVNAVLPPRFARLYQLGKIEELASLARKGALCGLLFASPLLILCFIFPKFLLGFFGAEFLEAAPLLRIITLAQAINVATGSVGFLLNMSGHEKLMRNISLGSNALGLVVLLTCAPLHGVCSAAWAIFIIVITQNIFACYYASKKLNFYIIPVDLISKK